ncbi:coiled-coil domain-containing protein 169 isoform X2 [Manis javanica]|uniref:coiled-coil domain-containing protein 169 isoform X2 n=1 Tax=Manis javanica TaxID=9974 RepID=UPI003C6D1810
MATPDDGAALPQLRGGRQESLTMLLKQLEKEKRSLESQVKGNAQREEQELKKYHSDIRYYGGVLLKTFRDFAVREDSAKVRSYKVPSDSQRLPLSHGPAHSPYGSRTSSTCDPCVCHAASYLRAPGLLLREWLSLAPSRLLFHVEPPKPESHASAECLHSAAQTSPRQ